MGEKDFRAGDFIVPDKVLLLGQKVYPCLPSNIFMKSTNASTAANGVGL
jgi:hypothetical protein